MNYFKSLNPITKFKSIKVQIFVRLVRLKIGKLIVARRFL